MTPDSQRSDAISVSSPVHVNADRLTTDALIGFVGLGNLGQAMSLNLVERGWNLRVYDAKAEHIESLTARGASGAAVAELAECDVLCFAVPDDAAVWEILRGPDALLERLGEHQTVIVHSTILPQAAQELAAAIDAAGAHFLDVPVSGGADRARSGDLTLMAGGSAEDLARVRPLLESIAAEIVHLGPAGCGSAAKLANQLIMFSALAGVHEAITLATAYGVTEAGLLESVGTGTGDTWVGRNWGFFDAVASAYNAGGTPVAQRPWSKDLTEVVDAADNAHLQLPLAKLLARTLADQVESHAAESENKGATP